MKISGKIVDASVDMVTGVPKLTLSVNERNAFLQGYDELKAVEKLSIEIKPYRAKRSLDANAYCWVLIHKIAEKLRKDPIEIYRESIRHIAGNSEVVCVKNEALERLCRGWTRNGLGWQVEAFPSKLEGCTNVTLYYGSSAYDTAQMSHLLDNLIQDAKANGIQTETPAQIAKMKALWEQAERSKR